MPKYKLEPDENLLQFAARFGTSLSVIWNHPENAKLIQNFKSPWLVGPREEIFVPDGEKDRRSAMSGEMRKFKKNPPLDVIEVHLGFMDEEVNARLAKLIDREVNAAKPRPVILIERGKLESTNPILEWRLGNYPVGDKESPIRKIIQVTGQEDPMVLMEGKIAKGNILDTEESVEPEDVLARAIRVYMEQNIPAERALKAKEIIVCRNCGLHRSVLDEVCEHCRVSVAVIICKECGVSKPSWSLVGQGCVAGKPHVWWETVKCLDDDGHSWRKPRDYDGKKNCRASNAIGNRHMWAWRQTGVEFGRAFDLVELIKHRSPGPPSKTKLPKDESGIGKGPWLSLVRFDVGPEKYEKPEDMRPPVIVIRTPEMGLQPSLMKPYLEFLFKAISLMSSQLTAEKAEKQELITRDFTKGKALPWNIWEWPLQVFQFGAQGSCSTQVEYQPGKIVTVIASLYVGVDIDKDGEAWSVVSLCTPAGIYDFVRKKIVSGKDLVDLESYAGPNPRIADWKRRFAEGPLTRDDRITAAQEIAAEIFRAQADSGRWNKLTLDKASIYRDPNSPYVDIESEIIEKTTLQKALDIIYKLYKQKYSSGAAVGVVTLTVSYFGGEEDKNAADALGIYSVGMEDYHVLRVLRSAFCQGISKRTDYPIVLGWRIDRIQCDPKKIAESLITEFNGYIRRMDVGADGKPTALLTAEEYADIIVWGLQGLITTVRPACADWNFVNYYWAKGDEWRKRLLSHFWSFSYSGGEDGFAVPNPFYIEIATDFLKELQEMKPGIAGIKDEEVKKEIIRLAKAVQTAWNDEGLNRGGYQTKQGGVLQEQPLKVEEKAYYGPGGDLTRFKAVELMNYIAKNCRFDSGRKKGDKPLLKTWLRPGKWGLPQNPVKESTTQDLTDQSRPEFDGACVDRAFYKTCNMMALQTMAGNLWEIYQPIETS
jgi:hypothetical protein